MPHPALPLQQAIVNALLSDDAITAVIEDRVFDHVPPDAEFPYLVIGDDSFSRDFWRHECFVTLLVCTKDETGGLVEVKGLSGLVAEALDRDLEVQGYRTIEAANEEMSFFKDEMDGTQWSEVEMVYLLEPVDHWERWEAGENV